MTYQQRDLGDRARAERLDRAAHEQMEAARAIYDRSRRWWVVYGTHGADGRIVTARGRRAAIRSAVEQAMDERARGLHAARARRTRAYLTEQRVLAHRVHAATCAVTHGRMLAHQLGQNRVWARRWLVRDRLACPECATALGVARPDGGITESCCR